MLQITGTDYRDDVDNQNDETAADFTTIDPELEKIFYHKNNHPQDESELEADLEKETNFSDATVEEKIIDELDDDEEELNVDWQEYREDIVRGLTQRVSQTFCRKKSKRMGSNDSFRNCEIRVLTLNDNEHLDSALLRIEKNWIVQFRLGPSLYGQRVHVYTNYPVTSDDYSSRNDEEFIRNQYRVLQWYQDEGCKYSDDTSAYCEVEAKRAGSFHYYFTYDKT